MDSAGQNLYIWPTIAQGGSLGLLGIYGVMSWRKAPRLAMAGLVALSLAGLFGVYLYYMQQDPSYFAMELPGDFIRELSAFSIVIGIALVAYFISSLLFDRDIKWIFLSTLIAIVATLMIIYISKMRVYESFHLVDAVIAEYIGVGRVPIPIFRLSPDIYMIIMVALPLLAVIGSSRLLFQKSRDWLRFSPWTIIPALAVFVVAVTQLQVRRMGGDYTQLMELMGLLFTCAVFIWAAGFNINIAEEKIQLRQMIGGIALGAVAGSLLQTFLIPFTFTHKTSVVIATLLSILVGGFLVIQIYNKVRTKFEAELEASRQERLAAIGRLASVTAHEIRNPLQSIRSIAQFIAMKTVGSELDKPAKVVMKETDRLDNILKRLLDFSRELKLTFAQVNLGDWWKDLKSIGGEMADVMNVRVEWVDPPGETALFDAERMRQVFINVFKNAIEASPDNGVIKAGLTVQRGKVVLRIDDRGPGINPQELDKIFSEFHTTKTEGSGLGLAVSRRIVEAHGGKLYFDLQATTGASLVAEWPLKPPKRILGSAGNE
jgi:signal transduction histidine kinase